MTKPKATKPKVTKPKGAKPKTTILERIQNHIISVLTGAVVATAAVTAGVCGFFAMQVSKNQEQIALSEELACNVALIFGNHQAIL
jgi:hypothetical protein